MKLFFVKSDPAFYYELKHSTLLNAYTVDGFVLIRCWDQSIVYEYGNRIIDSLYLSDFIGGPPPELAYMFFLDWPLLIFRLYDYTVSDWLFPIT